MNKPAFVRMTQQLAQTLQKISDRLDAIEEHIKGMSPAHDCDFTFQEWKDGVRHCKHALCNAVEECSHVNTVDHNWCSRCNSFIVFE